MKKEKGSFDPYLTENRNKTLAEAGRLEELGFNCRALKDRVVRVDRKFKPELIAEVPETVVFEN